MNTATVVPPFRIVIYLAYLSSAVYLYVALRTDEAGSFGLWMGHYLKLLLGNIAYLIPLIILISLCDRLWQLRERIGGSLNMPNWGRFMGLMVLFFALCGLVTIDTPSHVLNGGIIGQWIVQHLQNWFGFLGTILILNVLFLFAFTLSTAMSCITLFEKTGASILTLFKTSKKPEDNKLADLKSTQKRTLQEKMSWLTFKMPKFPQRKIQNNHTIPTRSEASPSAQQDQFADVLADQKFDQSLEIPPVSNQINPLDEPNFDAVAPTNLKTEPSATATIPTAPVASLTKAKSMTHMSGILPSVELLDPIPEKTQGYSETDLQQLATKLKDSLEHFNISITVEAIQPGPVVTLFEIQPAPGVKVNQISLLAKDLARAMAVQSVRVVDVIIGKSVIGIEIPNLKREMVSFKEILQSEVFVQSKHAMTLGLGKDIAGEAVVVDLAKMPHILVAGTTGSGKSVGINSMILSLIFKAPPEQVKFIMIDPKMLELSIYEGIPHLLSPVVTDMSQAANALKWSVAEMERRYKLMSILGVRNIQGMNDKIKKARDEGHHIKDPLYKPTPIYGHEMAEESPELEPLNFIVIVIDEFADLMMVVGKQIEELIARLAQKARAAGIHLILATQRPSVNVITGLIKANIPTRLSFQVSTKIDSRTIIDQGGAEQLLGMGDMLYLPPGSGLPMRGHGAFVSDAEVHRVVDFVKSHNPPPNYLEKLVEEPEAIDHGKKVSHEDEDSALYEEAVNVVMSSGKASISRIQRELRIGYNRAARLIEEMEAKGIVSKMNKNGLREIL